MYIIVCTYIGTVNLMAVINKRKILFSVIFLLAVISVTSVIVIILVRMGFGVSSPNNEPQKNFTTDELVYYIVDKLDDTSLSRVSPNNISKYYDIDESLISDATVYVSNKDESFSEISCFKLTNSDEYSKVEDAIKSHLSFSNANLKDFNPQESKKLNESKIEYCEPYVLVIVSDKSDSAAEIFNDLVTGKSENT